MSFTSVRPRAWLSERDCDLADFRELVERTTDLAGFPHASAVESNVLVYDSERLRAAASEASNATQTKRWRRARR